MYERKEIIKHSTRKTVNVTRETSSPHVLCRHTPNTQEINQMPITIFRTRFNVTVCLYLSLNSSARSLSTLIAVDVKTETINRT